MHFSCDKYDLEKYMLPLWKGNVVYNESIWFYRDKEGRAEADLLYLPDCLCEVRSSDLTILYEEGRDYVVNGRTVSLPEGSRIPCMAYDEYHFDQPSEGAWKTDDGAILFREGTYIHSQQIAITYTHSDVWEGYVPECRSQLLPKTMAKLEQGKTVRVMFYGDSITVGGNASGLFGVPPCCPKYADLTTDMLRHLYPNAEICYNRSDKSNMESSWGVEHALDFVVPQKPDLLIIAFGMNDGPQRTPEVFIGNLKKIMELVSNELPDCEYVLVGTSLANDAVYTPAGLKLNVYQPHYADAMRDLEKEGVALADLTSVHKYLLNHKRFSDMTGNNVNHPNDFLHRAQAQTVCACISDRFS